MKQRIERRWIPLSCLALCIGACIASRPDEGAAGRMGRPPTQVSYRGSSPYFKVDFDRFTGEATCVWCHPEASRIWHEEESFHVNAYSLLDDAARQRPECVKCHVTAFNQDGWYPLEQDEKQRDRAFGFTWGGDPEVNAHFEGVQCEACHGPNCGNKYSTEQLLAGCVRCHNEECPEYIGFAPEKAMTLLRHAAVGAVEQVPYDTYQGLASCNMCHYTNYEAWRRDQDPHVRAFEVLSAEEKRDARCLKCHTTGFNREGVHPLESRGGTQRSGFTFGGDSSHNARFEGVQCEACHGINCGTYTDETQIEVRCLACHSGECDNDDGFGGEDYFAKVRHRPPAEYEAVGETKVNLDWYSFNKGREVAETWRLPMLVLLSNPPDG